MTAVEVLTLSGRRWSLNLSRRGIVTTSYDQGDTRDYSPTHEREVLNLRFVILEINKIVVRVVF